MANFDKLGQSLANMAAGANTSCHEFTSLLKKLGFDIRDGSNGGHKIATHDGIKLTVEDGANYNCGPNPGTMVKRGYVKHFLGIVDDNEVKLRRHIDGL